MSSYWAELASNSNGYYQEEDFSLAAYRLVAEQVIYYADLKSRKAWGIIEQYERSIAKVLAPLGITLSVDRQLMFAYAIPQHASPTMATVPQTLFALVLRGLYEEGMRAGQLSDESGEIFCDFIELQEKYRLMTGRELPPKGELESLIRASRRWGIVRRVEPGDSHLPSVDIESEDGGIAIRPAIRVIFGESALQQLTLWQAPDNSPSSLPDDIEPEQPEQGDTNEAS